VIRRRKTAGRDGLPGLLSETQELVGRLLKENRALKSRNQRLLKELDRVSAGWDQIRKLARSAPRKPRG
jgi:hypothetical protein